MGRRRRRRGECGMEVWKKEEEEEGGWEGSKSTRLANIQSHHSLYVIAPALHPIRGLLMFFTNCCSSSQILTNGVAKETAMGGSCFLGDLVQD